MQLLSRKGILAVAAVIDRAKSQGFLYVELDARRELIAALGGWYMCGGV